MFHKGPMLLCNRKWIIFFNTCRFIFLNQNYFPFLRGNNSTWKEFKNKSIFLIVCYSLAMSMCTKFFKEYVTLILDSIQLLTTGIKTQLMSYFLYSCFVYSSTAHKALFNSFCLFNGLLKIRSWKKKLICMLNVAIAYKRHDNLRNKTQRHLLSQIKKILSKFSRNKNIKILTAQKIVFWWYM